MLKILNDTTTVVNEPEASKHNHISYRGRSENKLEKSPKSDSFAGDKADKKSKKKIIGISAVSLASLALLVTAICFKKGKGIEGEEKGVLKRIKDGFKKIIGRDSKAAEPSSVHPSAPEKPDIPSPSEVKPDSVEIPKNPEKPTTSELPKQPEAPKPESPSTENIVSEVQKPEVSRKLPFKRSEYPRSYTNENGENVLEEICSCSGGDEYIRTTIKDKNGVVLRKILSHNGSTLKSSEIIYENGREVKTIYYEEDGIRKSYEELANGTTNFYAEDGVTISRTVLPEKPKLLNINRSLYPKKYVNENGENVLEEICSYSEDEYIRTTIKDKNGVVLRKILSHNGSTLKSSEIIYENGREVKTIYYEEDGIRKSYEELANGTTNYYAEDGVTISRTDLPEKPKTFED